MSLQAQSHVLLYLNLIGLTFQHKLFQPVLTMYERAKYFPTKQSTPQVHDCCELCGTLPGA